MPIDNIYVQTVKFLQNLFTESSVITGRIDNMVDILKGSKADVNAAKKIGRNWASKVSIVKSELEDNGRYLKVKLVSPKDQYGDYIVDLQTSVDDPLIRAKLLYVVANGCLDLEVLSALEQMFVQAALKAIGKDPEQEKAEKDEFFKMVLDLFEEEINTTKKDGVSHCSCVEHCTLDDDEEEESGPEYDCLCGKECCCEPVEPIETEEDCEPGKDPLVDNFCLDPDEYIVINQNACGRTEVAIYKRRSDRGED